MRDIIFRGKRKDNGEWIYGDLVGGDMICNNLVDVYDELGTYYGETPYVGFMDVTRETVGQFTGLYDKNDKKIYEGDIVKTKYGRLCIVVWFSNQVHNGWDLNVICTVENCVHTRYPDSVDLYKKENLEIVGNIHDNPEMLPEDGNAIQT